MKYKLSLALLFTLPAFAHAGGGNFNFYGKAGIDLTSRFETMKIILPNINKEANVPASSRQNTFSPSIFLETTYNILPQTEIGLGLGYIKRKGFDHSATWKISNQGNIGFGDNNAVENYRINRYSSLPIYFTLKQNYALNANSKFYLKGDIGYSINKIDNTKYNYYTDVSGKLELDSLSSRFQNFKAQNGLYLGLGIGFEYKFFLADIGYYHTHAKVNYKSDGSYSWHPYNNDAIRLTLGFKF
ncbi:hypothetical protein HNR69_001674 [Histophilus somni]|uniref:hypothetical protein n=1 Tax=Histophilus somni TaxID=731 RepID=UPI000B3B9A44|nr:hypothetical protein [Histophilus somni]ARU64575.1 hypothetical protein BTV18_03220 [Histophilus somni]ARU74446.1 hypothetical protein BTV22_06390 [Histophilus somni]MBB5152212.1 hypothetical protein [Histophilus somni]